MIILGGFMKVLKSFVDAHSAVQWLSQNRIEGASIELTGTIKSMGFGVVPSGNYHVVLKAQSPEERQARAEARLQDPTSAIVAGENAYNTRKERIDKTGAPVDPADPNMLQEAASRREDLMEVAGEDVPLESEGGPTDRTLNQFSGAGKPANYDKQGLPTRFTSENRSNKNPDGTPIRPEKMKAIIKKAVIDALKSTVGNSDTENKKNEEAFQQGYQDYIERHVEKEYDKMDARRENEELEGEKNMKTAIQKAVMDALKEVNNTK